MRSARSGLGLLRRISCLVVLAAFPGACAKSLVRDDVHEKGWLLVQTPHIALRTDLDEEDALARARQLERYWQALARMYGVVVPRAVLPAGELAVIHFKSCRDFARISSRPSYAGFVFDAGYWMDRQIAVTCEASGDPTLVHELAHVFNHHFFSSLPVWAEEGLASYYETLAVKEGAVEVGILPAKFASFMQRPAWLPSLEAIRRMDYEQFHEESAEGGNYFSAWKLVHLLSSTGPERQQRFRRYLASLALSPTSEDAWAQAFADLPAGPLLEDFKWYHRRLVFNGWGARFQWSEKTAPRVRALRAGEAHILWAVLLANANHRPEALTQLDRLAAADPDWPELVYWRAVLLEPADRLQLLRRYVASRPDDGRGWRALVSAELDRVLPPKYLGVDEPPPSGLDAMESDVHRLVEHANDATSLNLIGWYFAMRQKPATGLNFALRSLQAEPRCGPCWDTAGLLYFQAGKVAKALDAQERAVRIYAERAPPDVLVRLRRFRAAAAAARK